MGGKRSVCSIWNLRTIWVDTPLRNAAKARSKDTTGRAQKDFFGRQRLNILSKGLIANSRGLDVPAGKRQSEGSMFDIGLAHAKCNPLTPEVHQHSFIPSPVYVSPCAPKFKSKSFTHYASSSSTGSNRSSSSKVLDALDMSERESCSPFLILSTKPFLVAIFLRAAMDRILTLPDLAGLSKRKQRLPVTPRPPPKSYKRIKYPCQRQAWTPFLLLPLLILLWTNVTYRGLSPVLSARIVASSKTAISLLQPLSRMLTTPFCDRSIISPRFMVIQQNSRPKY
jgi:hypothetical protein